jgi:hypothetical protein
MDEEAVCERCGKHFKCNKYDLKDKKEKIGHIFCKACQCKWTNKQKHGDENYNNKEKFQKTNIEKYGSKSPFGNEEIQSKAKNSTKEKYGEECVFSLDSFQKKAESTFIEKYGVNRPLKSDTIKEKVKKTNEEKYGKFFTQTDEFKEKSDFTRIKNSGSVEASYKEAEEKAESTKLLKYGDKNFNNREKCKATCLEKYGVKSNLVIEDFSPKRVSKAEKEIADFIRTLYVGEVIENSRKILSDGREPDIYIPGKNLAIEYDGIYWHNDVDNSFKYDECKEKKIRLIQIVENEWKYDNEKIKNYLRFIFGKYDKRIGARKCYVKEIEDAIYRDFCDENHIQNSCGAKIKLGLFYGDELVQIMSFGKPRFNKKYEYEMIRECSKADYDIIGGKSKLLKYFIRKYNPKSIISYCEKNKFTGKSYIDLGFSLIRETPSDYKYYLSSERWSKPHSHIEFQKHKLADKLKDFDSSLTEKKNMFNNKNYAIYDYGNFVFSLILSYA